MQELDDREVDRDVKNFYNLPHGRVEVTVLGIHPDRDYSDNPIFRLYVHDVEYADGVPSKEEDRGDKYYLPTDIIIDTSIRLTDDEEPGLWSMTGQLILYQREHGSIVGDTITLIVDDFRDGQKKYYIKEVQEMIIDERE